MKKIILMFAIIAIGVLPVNAQTESENYREVVNQPSEEVYEDTQKEFQEDIQPVLKPTFGDYYTGLTKKITFDR
ncbi:MAG: hypothetical protein LBH58_09855, partial [Tannerellaceae bacterium]|nr:hypothetical protein [Tannerellaceae bacterium]